jgi:hypothetical protein
MVEKARHILNLREKLTEQVNFIFILSLVHIFLLYILENGWQCFILLNLTIYFEANLKKHCLDG